MSRSRLLMIFAVGALLILPMAFIGAGQDQVASRMQVEDESLRVAARGLIEGNGVAIASRTQIEDESIRVASRVHIVGQSLLAA